MDIKHLQYFIQVSHFNSFTKAAEQLFITQPTISKMIKNLENELGVELFDRSRKQLTLTDAGRVVLEQAKLINQAFNNLEREVADLTGLHAGHIRIGIPPIIDTSFFPKIIGRFHEQYPNITYQIIEDGSKKIEDSIENDVLDIGVIVLPTNSKVFHSFELLEENIRLILHPNHPLAKSEEVRLEDLRNENFILFNKDFVLRDLIISSCINVGYTPHIMAESSRWDFIEEMVASNLGIALLPESLSSHLANRVLTKIVKPTISLKFGVVWSKNRHSSFAANEWLQFTRNTIGKSE